MTFRQEILVKTARPFFTSAVALLGAAAVAASPVQPIRGMSPVGQHAMESFAVELAATIDPITPWVDTFTSAAANIKTLLEFYAQRPLPLLQTSVANAQTYLGELLSGNGNLIPAQIVNNIQTLFQAPFSPGATVAFPLPPGSQTPLAIGEYLSGTSTGLTTPNLSYKLLFSEIVAQSGSAACQDRGDCLVVNAGPVLNLINTHFSGLFFGLAGTVLAPVIQLGRSFTAIGDFIKAGDVVAAINEFINIPANVTNAFLNGSGYLDRTAAVGMLIPGGLPVDSIGVEIGGLLSSTPYNGSLTDPSNPPTKWTGGVGFDGVTTTTGSTTLRGLKFGFLGSVVGMGQFLSDKLLIPSPQAGQAVAPAPVKSAAAAPAAAAPAAAPVVAEAPAPAVVEAPAAPAAIDIPAAVEAPAAAPAPAVAEAPAHRDGGGNNKSDNGSPAKGHRGAPSSRGSH